MMRFSALSLLLALDSSSAFATRNLQEEELNATAPSKFYEPPAAFNETGSIMDTQGIVYPESFWVAMNNSMIVYDTFGLMNGTDSPPGFIEYAPTMAMENTIESNMTGIPVAYYLTAQNDSLPLYSVPRSFFRMGGDNGTAVAMESGVAPAMAMEAPEVQLDAMPMMLLSTSPVSDFLEIETAEAFIPVSLGNDALVAPTTFNGTTVGEKFPVVMERIDAVAMQGDSSAMVMTVTMSDEMPGNFELPVFMDEVAETDPPIYLPTVIIDEVVTMTVPPNYMEDAIMDGVADTPPLADLPLFFDQTEEVPPTIVLQTAVSDVELPVVMDEVDVAGDVGETVTTTSLTVGVPVPAKTSIKSASGTPAWWDVVKANYKGTDLKGCKKRKNIPPVVGSECPMKKEKTCFFGNQECPAAYPDTVCKCSAGKWSCSATKCP